MSAAAHLYDPQTLYRHWENEQWNPWSIDLTADRVQWQRSLADQDKALVYWALSSLMVAEERITTQFSGLVMAAASEEEATFLATQQVDEARHMQFYARFQDEVIATTRTACGQPDRSRREGRLRHHLRHAPPGQCSRNWLDATVCRHRSLPYAASPWRGGQPVLGVA